MRSRRWVLLAAAIFAVAVVLDRRAGRVPSDQLCVDLLDVGQGDALAIRFPTGEFWIVDGGGGGALDPGAAVVVPHLARQGVERLDRVILSHAHPDHFEGLVAVVEALPVGELVVPTLAHGSDRFQRLLDVAERRGVPIRVLEEKPAGVEWRGAVEVEWLAAGGAGHGGRPLGANDGSAVLRLRFGGVRFLLTGDIEGEGEQRLLDAGVDLRAEVVKAPHHLSKTSSSAAFVGAVRPWLVLAGAGEENRYGFPHAGPMQRWLAGGAVVRWTGRHGAVRTCTDGSQLTLARAGARGRFDSERTWSGSDLRGPPQPSAFAATLLDSHAVSFQPSTAVVRPESRQGRSKGDGPSIQRRDRAESARHRGRGRSRGRGSGSGSHTAATPDGGRVPKAKPAKVPAPSDPALVDDKEWIKARAARAKDAARRR